MLQISAYPPVEVDHLAPIQARVDVADGAASRAAEVGADVPPIPVRQILQRYLPAVSAQLALGRPDAIDEHGFEAGAAIDGAFPVFKPSYRFSAPGHGASKALKSARQITPWVGPGTDPRHCRSGLLKSQRRESSERNMHSADVGSIHGLQRPLDQVAIVIASLAMFADRLTQHRRPPPQPIQRQAVRGAPDRTACCARSSTPRRPPSEGPTG
jgi:hypothetical protein